MLFLILIYLLPHALFGGSGVGENILVRTVMKANVGVLEDEVREVFNRRLMN